MTETTSPREASTPVTDPYEAFLARFVPWAEARDDIRGVVLVGSRARAVRPADELSDVDLMLITRNPKFYFTTVEWLNDFGDLCFTYRQPPIVGDRSIRTAIYEGPVHIDFAIVSDFESRWAGAALHVLARFPRLRRLLPGGLADQIEAWFAILRKGRPPALVNKGGAATRMHGVRPPRAQSMAPTQVQFDEVVAAFWSHCLWTSKLVLRGELWMAVFVSDHLAKTFLLQMLEWNAWRPSGVATDVWYNGRFLEHWVGDDVASRLRGAFPHYDERDIWNALESTMDVFSLVGREASSRLGRSYLDRAEATTRQWVASRRAAADVQAST